jgi:VanZ family protein
MRTFLRWLPAIVMMTAIFVFSSQPSSDLPDFLGWDTVIKKGGHMVGYGALAVSYSYALRDRSKKTSGIAWMLAILYALTDEYHQSFIPGRHPSLYDVFIFDNLGAFIALFLLNWRKSTAR